MPDIFYGSFCLLLHSHIPYVLNHGQMGEEWLYEATAETYIPLLNIFNRLYREGIKAKVTMNISPILAEQLNMKCFHERFKTYCNRKIEYAIRDFKFFNANDHMKWLATLWRKFYFRTKKLFVEEYKEDIINAFKQLHDKGCIEIITCGATHGYFPAFLRDTSISAQIKMAARCHQNLFGFYPSGIWLPECGYRPSGKWTVPLTKYKNDIQPHYRQGIEEILSRNRLRFFVIDQIQLKNGWPRDIELTPFKTYFVKENNCPVTIFVRDTNISEQIWNHQIGYPGDSSYLEFHKKHSPGMHRYWKITDRSIDMAYKNPYSPEEVKRERIPQHAGHYKWLIKQALKDRFSKTGNTGLVVTAFDSELFGHWWFEGPAWLYQLIKWIYSDPEIAPVTCSEYLNEQPATDLIHLQESSWGRGYDSSTWINNEVEWVWERLYWAEMEMAYLARDLGNKKDDEIKRILKQSIRELLILQASDWEFMITNWSTRDYAEKRIVEHHSDFARLAKMAWSYAHGSSISDADEKFLKDCEERDPIFTDPDPNWYND